MSAASTMLAHPRADPASRPEHGDVAASIGEEFRKFARRRRPPAPSPRGSLPRSPPAPRAATRSSPARRRRAARRAPQAAPRRSSRCRPRPPRHGRACICGRRAAAGETARPKARANSGMFAALIRSSTLAGMPMSATSMRPQCSRPGSSRCPGFLRKNVTVSRAMHRRAHHRAGRSVDAARQIDRTDRTARGIHRLDQRARLALHRPVEAGAEQRVDDDMRARQPRRIRRLRSRRSSVAPRSRHRLCSRSMLPTSSTWTHSRARRAGAPRQSRRRHCCRSRPRPRSATRSAAAARRSRRPPCPPRSIRSMPGIPPAIARRSASPISALVRSSIMLGDFGGDFRRRTMRRRQPISKA